MKFTFNDQTAFGWDSFLRGHNWRLWKEAYRLFHEIPKMQ